jgi:hypothetical protein
MLTQEHMNDLFKMTWMGVALGLAVALEVMLTLV